MKTLSRIFQVQSLIALAGWLVLMVFPHWPAGRDMVIGIVVFLLASLYVFLLLFGKRFDDPSQKVRGNFRTLKGVMALFQSPRAVLAGWVHYLAFDLMIGLFILVDSQGHDITHWLVIPCLLLTLLFGPAGLLAYMILRAVMIGEFSWLLY